MHTGRSVVLEGHLAARPARVCTWVYSSALEMQVETVRTTGSAPAAQLVEILCVQHRPAAAAAAAAFAAAVRLLPVWVHSRHQGPCLWPPWLLAPACSSLSASSLHSFSITYSKLLITMTRISGVQAGRASHVLLHIDTATRCLALWPCTAMPLASLSHVKFSVEAVGLHLGQDVIIRVTLSVTFGNACPGSLSLSLRHA